MFACFHLLCLCSPYIFLRHTFLACPYLFADCVLVLFFIPGLPLPLWRFVLFRLLLFPWPFLFTAFVQAARCVAVAPQITTSLFFITTCPLVPLGTRVRGHVIPPRVRRAWCYCDVLAFATYILTPFCHCSSSHFCDCSFCCCFVYIKLLVRRAWRTATLVPSFAVRSLMLCLAALPQRSACILTPLCYCLFC